ncbi:CsbD family protein [Streptomyces sp. NPDC017993]|uniref:CsbD family protein n=1 Tax=Streptomyces sp. NPDC017993 TaxID=3365027 RepID=UPI0037B05AC4
MSRSEKARARAEELKGTLKRHAGRAVGNERMATEGQAERSMGAARQAKEKVKDMFRHKG